MAAIAQKSLSISIGHFRHATLLFTALLLIVTNGCAAGEKVDLKDRCMKYPLHLMCRGSVMKRGVPKMHNLDAIFDDYLRSKLSRFVENDYPHRRNSILNANRLSKKEGNDLYEYYMSARQAKRTNRSKLLDSLLPPNEKEWPRRYARNAKDLNVNDVNYPNSNGDLLQLLDNFEYE